MAYAYPDGLTQSMHDAAHCAYDENDRARAAQELAEEDWDKFIRGEDPHGDIASFVDDNLLDWGPELMRGGDDADRARREIRTGALRYAAWLMDEDRIDGAL